MKLDDLALEKATLADLPAILSVENASFTHPWSASVFKSELRNPLSTVQTLKSPTGRLLAFVVYWMVDDELHLLDIAVDPEFRRRGIARWLMGEIESIGRRAQITYITLEVRVSNLGAIELYQSLDYSTIRRQPEYYVDENEDALVMAKVLDCDKEN